ncbi:DUF707 domain-containing protein [Nocardia sp. NBC_01503]|uniref:DUF707 domain-containing protein n=1 Tax=Nocardia sp. NBC_01503 TaxID=2975997 RepID=UPI002E7B7693|nr:DUF707 domain-containing protein [Nocardia sp. NBC_01503]WTL36393.1 DUF707 domain-containing protein [Nocardia sp. NBC_01503]
MTARSQTERPAAVPPPEQAGTQRRNLVILRAGDSSLHERWLAGPQRRTWDLVVSYFGDDPQRYRGGDITRLDRKGPKWPALHHVLTVDLAEVIDRYDYIWLPDDDLATDTGTINDLFEFAARYRLSLAQPALTEDSYFTHEITLVDRRFELRYTNFVEIMAPCFSREFLARCLPTFDRSQTGWGLDFHWPRFAPDTSEVAIVDAVTVRHTRPVGGPNVAAVRAAGVDPTAEYLDYLRAHGIYDLSTTVHRGIGAAGRALPEEPTAVCVSIDRPRPELPTWLRYHCARVDLVIVFTDHPAVRAAVEELATEHSLMLCDSARIEGGDTSDQELADIAAAVTHADAAGMRWLLPLALDELFYDDGRRRWQLPGAGQVTFLGHEAVPVRHPVVNPFEACTVFRVSGRSPFLDTPSARSAVRLGPGVTPVDPHGFTGFSGASGMVTAPMILHYPYPSFESWLARAAHVAETGGTRARQFAYHSRELLQVALAHTRLEGARACFQAAIPSDGMVDRMVGAGELLRVDPMRTHTRQLPHPPIRSGAAAGTRP